MAYDEQFMKKAIEIAKQGALFDEVPIGCVIVKEGEIVASSTNLKERENCATRHAEMVALELATKELGNWWLENCDVYVTLEPCAMCAMAMIHSRIRALYFGAYDKKAGACGSKLNVFEKGMFNHDVQVEGGFFKEECADILSSFFKTKRKASKA